MDIAQMPLLQALATVLNQSKKIVYAREVGQTFELYPTEEELAELVTQVVLLHSYDRVSKALTKVDLPASVDKDQLSAIVAKSILDMAQ